MARVEGELRIVDPTGGTGGCDERDRLRTAVRQHDALGIDADRRRERVDRRLGVGIATNRLCDGGDERGDVGRERVEARREVEHRARFDTEPSSEARAVAAVVSGWHPHDTPS